MTFIDGIVIIFVIAALSGAAGKDTESEMCLMCVNQKHEYAYPTNPDKAETQPPAEAKQ